MRSSEELFIFLVSIALLWTFPIVKMRKSNRRTLLIHLIVQITYSFFFIGLLDSKGEFGSSLLWLFYWVFITLAHLIGLNFWALFKEKRSA